MKVFDTFGTKVIKSVGGSLLSDFGVEKIEKMQNDPPTIKHRRVCKSVRATIFFMYTLLKGLKSINF